MGNIVDAKFDMEVFDRGTDATFLVPSRDDDGEQGKRRSFCFWSIGHASVAGQLKPVWILLRMLRNFLKNRLHLGSRGPVPFRAR